MRAILFFVILVVPAFADINFSKIVACSDNTTDGYIFIDNDSRLIIKSLTVIGLKNGACAVGAILPSSTEGSKVNMLLYPDLKHLGPFDVVPINDRFSALTQQQMRDEVLLTQTTLKDKLEELAKLKDELRRLETDAEIIANVGKIASVREHLSKVKEATEAIIRDNQALSKVIEDMGRGSTAPRRLKQRITESTNILNTMVRLFGSRRAGEESDNAAIADNIRDTMDRLIIAESANIENLEIELNNLQKQNNVGK